MSLELQITELTAAVKHLTSVMTSGNAAALNDGAATEGTKDKTADKPATGTKATGAKAGKGKTDAPKEPEAPKGPTWAEVVEKIRELNSSEAEGHGREAIQELIKAFLPKGGKVPALEAVNKHAEILTWVENRLAGTPDDGSAAGAADDEDDLGL